MSDVVSEQARSGVRPERKDAISDTVSRLLPAFERTAGGVIASLVALAVLVGVVLLIPTLAVGVGFLALPAVLRVVRSLARRQRELVGAGVTASGSSVPASPRACVDLVLHDPTLHRELLWLGWHATGGLIIGLLTLLLPVLALRDLTFPLWWRAVPPGDAAASIGFIVRDWTSALAVGSMGLAWAAVTVGLVPVLDRVQAQIGRRLLGPDPQAELQERITHLATTRADALQAHTNELRRIERALHDGAQNRLLAVVVRVGAARRALDRDPAAAAASLEEAGRAAESAVAELRAVVRDMLPPGLDQHGLAAAVGALAAGCSVRCTVESDNLGALPTSIETTAYHVVAEALTNISRHSGASTAHVRMTHVGASLRITVIDDGHGGATVGAGSGLDGIRRRVAAHDGHVRLASPAGGPTELDVELPCTS